jgi:hypothetical protein
MLNGTKTPLCLKRLRIAQNARCYHLPASLGAFFPSCWDGTSTRHHLQDGTTCPNCGRIARSERWQSLHAVKTDRGNGPRIVLAVDHRLTVTLAEAIPDRSYLARPLDVVFRPDGRVTLAIASQECCRPGDIQESAERIVRIWQQYFRGGCAVSPGSLHSGNQWLD